MIFKKDFQICNSYNNILNYTFEDFFDLEEKNQKMLLNNKIAQKYFDAKQKQILEELKNNVESIKLKDYRTKTIYVKKFIQIIIRYPRYIVKYKGNGVTKIVHFVKEILNMKGNERIHESCLSELYRLATTHNSISAISETLELDGVYIHPTTIAKYIRNSRIVTKTKFVQNKEVKTVLLMTDSCYQKKNKSKKFNESISIFSIGLDSKNKPIFQRMFSKTFDSKVEKDYKETFYKENAMLLEEMFPNCYNFKIVGDLAVCNKRFAQKFGTKGKFYADHYHFKRDILRVIGCVFKRRKLTSLEVDEFLENNIESYTNGKDLFNNLLNRYLIKVNVETGEVTNQNWLSEFNKYELEIYNKLVKNFKYIKNTILDELVFNKIESMQKGIFQKLFKHKSAGYSLNLVANLSTYKIATKINKEEFIIFKNEEACERYLDHQYEEYVNLYSDLDNRGSSLPIIDRGETDWLSERIRKIIK